MVQQIPDYNAVWFLGKGSLEECLVNAEKLKHKFIVAKDYQDKVGDKVSKIYGSYKNSREFVKCTKNVEQNEKTFYVIVPDKVKCCLFGDLEWNLQWNTEDHIKSKFVQSVITTAKNINVEMKETDFLFLSASDTSKNKGSLHVHNPYVCFNNIEEQRVFFNSVEKCLTDDDYFIDETEKSYIQKTFIDFGVYNKNRQIRLPFSGKRKQDGISYRPLMPADAENFDFPQYTIVDVNDAEDNIVNVATLPKDITITKKQAWNKQLIQSILDSQNLGVSVETFKGNNLIQLKNKLGSRKCPISNMTHENNNAYLVIKDNKLNYCCHSEHCKGKHNVIYEQKREDKLLHEEPPFEWYYHEYHKMKAKCEDEEKFSIELTNLQEKFMTEINQYIVRITGASEIYYLYRVIREKDGIRFVDWRAKKHESLRRLYEAFNITLNKKIVLGITFYLKAASKVSYLFEDCKPYENMNSKDKDPNSFNTFDGLTISKEDAIEKGNNDPTEILNFISKAWANDNEEHYNYILNWMAHLIQKPWIKMKTSMVLQGTEGCGKGMIIQILGKIVGYKHFYQPTDISDLLGNFNSMLENKLLVYANEMLWGGDKKAAGVLKKLLTEERMTLNEKNMPKREVSNCINWFFDSNESWIVPAGCRERRYSVFKVGNFIYTLTPAELERIYNFCPYSFAKVLYTRNISGFNPHKHLSTDGLKEQKQLTMCPVHKFWLSMIENQPETFGTEQIKSSIHEDFLRSSYSGQYQRDSRCFWIETNKVFGKLPEVRKRTKDDPLAFKQDDNRYYHITLPTHEEAAKRFNELYDCSMLCANV